MIKQITKLREAGGSYLAFFFFKSTDECDIPALFLHMYASEK